MHISLMRKHLYKVHIKHSVSKCLFVPCHMYPLFYTYIRRYLLILSPIGDLPKAIENYEKKQIKMEILVSQFL